MTDDEREAEIVKQTVTKATALPLNMHDGLLHNGIAIGVKAGRDSMRNELRAESALRQMDIKQCMRLDDELKAERELTAKLIELVETLMRDNRGVHYEKARKVLAELNKNK